MYTVVGGISVNPDDPDTKFKNVFWDDEGDVKLLREKYAVSVSMDRVNDG
jgi:salicylate hydroxylase